MKKSSRPPSPVFSVSARAAPSMRLTSWRRSTSLKPWQRLETRPRCVSCLAELSRPIVRRAPGVAEQPAARATGPTPEVAAADYALVVWRQRRLVLAVTVVTIVAAFVATLLSPRIYESVASVIAPKEGAGNNALSSLALTGLVMQVPALSLPSLTPNRDLLVSVLRSRTMAVRVVERFQLQERYRVRYLEDAIRRLQSATTVSVSREGVIMIRVEDTDPRRASDMANFHAEQLDRLVA